MLNIFEVEKQTFIETVSKHIKKKLFDFQCKADNRLLHQMQEHDEHFRSHYHQSHDRPNMKQW